MPGNVCAVPGVLRWIAVKYEVFILHDEPYIYGSVELESRAPLALPAPPGGRIQLIDGTLVSWYGPRIAEAIQILAGFFANSRGLGTLSATHERLSKGFWSGISWTLRRIRRCDGDPGQDLGCITRRGVRISHATDTQRSERA